MGKVFALSRYACWEYHKTLRIECDYGKVLQDGTVLQDGKVLLEEAY